MRVVPRTGRTERHDIGSVTGAGPDGGRARNSEFKAGRWAAAAGQSQCVRQAEVPSEKISQDSCEGAHHVKMSRATADARGWEELARFDPLWAVASSPQLRHGKWDEEEFYEGGRRKVRKLMKQLDALGVPCTHSNDSLT
jgi:hypothetical protein